MGSIRVVELVAAAHRDGLSSVAGQQATWELSDSSLGESLKETEFPEQVRSQSGDWERGPYGHYISTTLVLNTVILGNGFNQARDVVFGCFDIHFEA